MLTERQTIVARSLALTALLALAASCGGSGGGGPAPFDPPPSFDAFQASPTPPGPDRIWIDDIAVGAALALRVNLGGPTTSDDLYTFAFDLELTNPDVLEYIDGSATLGEALNPSTGQTTLQVSQQGNRIVVGISSLGGGSGNRADGVETAVVSLRFRALAAGVSQIRFAGPVGAPGAANDPAVLDSTGAVISSIQFDTEAVTVTVVDLAAGVL